MTENKNKERTERKPIEPISSITPEKVFTGFYVNEGKFGESVLLFDADGNAYSLNGFAGRQFIEEILDERLLNKEFKLTLEKKFSNRYQREYYVISEVDVIRTKTEVQKKLKFVEE